MGVQTSYQLIVENAKSNPNQPTMAQWRHLEKAVVNVETTGSKLLEEHARLAETLASQRQN